MLTRLSITNYKSLHSTTINPPGFFSLVGANAAGKSNFADAIEFLATIARSGLAAALNEKGGYENVCFRRQRRSKGAIGLDCTIETKIDTKYPIRMNWQFAFKAGREAIRSDYHVQSEKVDIDVDYGDGYTSYITINRLKDKLELSQPGGSKPIPGFLPLDLLRRFLDKDTMIRHDDLVAWTYLRGLPPFSLFFKGLAAFRVYQISPSSARKPGAASGNQELGKYGDNLPSVLEWLSREHKDLFNTLLDYVRLAVPTIEKLETGYVETRELGLFVREAHIRRRLFASELSDGTLRTLAMFVPLIDPRYPLVVVEEPENSIHPWVVRRFVEACRSRSANKQIILTTHSPVLVSQLNPDELFIADKIKGETRIVRATQANSEVDEIIRSGIQDLGSYWDSGAMRAVPIDPQFEFMNEL